MKDASVRAAVLLLVGVLVTALTLYAPEVGAAVAGAATVVTLLAELREAHAYFSARLQEGTDRGKWAPPSA
ncbi:hypothetical protein [Streptomyces sp. NPDC001948]